MREIGLHWDAPQPTAGEILRRAHSLVDFGWCQRADATDAMCEPVHPWSVRACRWSLLGALVAAIGIPKAGEAESDAVVAELRVALLAVGEIVSDPSLEQWNDHPTRTQADVLAMLAAARSHLSASRDV